MSELLGGLILGLAGSAHCAAMCGPLTLALHGRQPTPGAGPARALVPIALHHAGRLSVYAAAGLAAGTAGHAVTVMGAGRGLAWLAGAVVLLSAATHLGLGRSLPSLPIVPLIGRLAQGSRRLLDGHPVAGALAGGAVNAWLPCGLVYAALTAAAAFGRPVAGLAFMVLFGLGTLPALAAVWLVAGAGAPVVRRGLRFATPVALVVVGLLLIARGYSHHAGSREPAPASPHAHGPQAHAS